jgi:broad specificity phosphatase PhoE
MRLVMVRHAESTNNAHYAAGRENKRVPDPLLTSSGHHAAVQCAAALSQRFKGYPALPQCVVASPSARSVQTAAAIAETLQVPVSLDPMWIEGGGLYSVDAAQTRHPAAGRSPRQLGALVRMPLRTALPSDVPWPGGFEAHEDIAKRAAIAAEHLSLDVDHLVVTHEWFAQFVLRRLLGLSTLLTDISHGWFGMPNCGIAIIEVNPDGRELVHLGAP